MRTITKNADQKPTDLTRILYLLKKTIIWSLHHWVYWEIFQKDVRIWEFWQSYLEMFIFSTFQCNCNSIYKNDSENLIFDFSMVQIAKWWVIPYYVSPTAWFLQRLSCKFLNWLNPVNRKLFVFPPLK